MLLFRYLIILDNKPNEYLLLLIDIDCGLGANNFLLILSLVFFDIISLSTSLKCDKILSMNLLHKPFIRLSVHGEPGVGPDLSQLLPKLYCISGRGNCFSAAIFDKACCRALHLSIPAGPLAPEQLQQVVRTADQVPLAL